METRNSQNALKNDEDGACRQSYKNAVVILKMKISVNTARVKQSRMNGFYIKN